MLKRILVVFICLCASFSSSLAQDFSILWKDHFSYNAIVDETRSESKLYAAAENAIFSYDFTTGDIETITTINGLSGDRISTIEFSESAQLLLIGYGSGLIEVYFEDDKTVLSVVDILEKITIDPSIRGINDFFLFEDLAYVSTDFGISVYDINRLEFGDTYFIGPSGSQIPVEKTTVANGQIYAACSMNFGIYTASVDNPNLIDFQQWQNIISGDFRSIEMLNDNIYALRSNRGLIQVVNNTAVNIQTFNSLPVDTEVAENRLLYTTPTNVYIYDDGFNLVAQINPIPEFDTRFTSAMLFEDDIYIGTEDFGVLATETLNPIEPLEIRPNGPLRNDTFKLDILNSVLYTTFGDYDIGLNPFPLDSRGISRLMEGEWQSKPFDSILGARSLTNPKINPNNTNQVFIGSFHDGLLEFNDFEATTLFDNTNSPLKSIILPGAPNFVSIRVAALTFDEDGRLWTTTSLVDDALSAYNPASQQWQQYSFEDAIQDPLNDEQGFPEMAIDRNGTKFVGARRNGIIGYNETLANPIKRFIGLENGLPSNAVRALAFDQRNQLWIGTEKGLRVMFNSSEFFEDDITVEPIIFLENGLARELLENQFITDIKVDGSNNKWIGTADSGVFLVSPNGQTIIYRFTKANSPLPNNTINDIVIDDNDGTVYFATPNGMVSFRAGGSQPVEDLESAYVYPNPVRPNYDILGFDDLNDITKGIKIVGLTENVNVKITDIAGNLVAEAQSRINRRSSDIGYNFAIDGGTGIWNGKNLGNNVVASGVYLILISDLDTFETKVLKLLIVR
ncbi:two-component regulator propeller domain-containing protein [Winogradskyella maritima]|uniref:Two-component regulator propeller domain-containing protein n=1 Tax=Winogradskyella maritima TaxID=1517766 RepID=A0ABV8AEK0_9FLAO|nr:two-component regulator propeller domain-containing protein [Winogradskyella maritima]